MTTAFTRDRIVDAFRELGERAWARGVVIDLAVYGGSCLALASNFRISTRDVDAVALRDQAVLDELAAEVGVAPCGSTRPRRARICPTSSAFSTWSGSHARMRSWRRKAPPRHRHDLAGAATAGAE